MQMSESHSGNPRARRAAAVALAALLTCLVLGATAHAGPTTAALSSPISEEALEARGSEPISERPSFVVIQTDDETLEQLYTVFNAGGVEIPAMPNTLSMIAGRGMTFNRYYVSYPLCC